jgi:glutathione S-transferase
VLTTRRHFLDINPKGLVPALEYKGRPLNESLVIAEFVEDAFHDHKPHLLPTDAFERARVRLSIDLISKKIVPAWFRTIQAQEEDRQQAGREDLYKALQELVKEVKGPYFLGEEFSLVDTAIAPFAVRDYILKDHRGYSRADASEDWKKYAEALEDRDSVKRTSSVSRMFIDISHLLISIFFVQELQHYEEIYGRYLRNEAQSEVAKATRGGQDLP